MDQGRPIRIAGLRWYLAPGLDAAEAGPRIAAALAARARGEAPNLRSGQRKMLHALRLAGGADPDHLLKAYTYRFLPGLLRAFRPSKSRRELRLAVATAARGLPVPIPTAAGERRRLGRLQACFLLVPILRDVIDLRRLWFDEAPAPARRRRLARGLGAFSRRVHEAGLFQDDFAPNNFLVRGGAEPEFLLVDFERARLLRRLGRARRRWMLAKLSRHMDDATAAERMRFLRAYTGDDRDEARRWWRDLEGFAPRLARRDHRRMRRNSVAEGRNFRRIRLAAGSGFLRPRAPGADPGALPAPPAGAAARAPGLRAAGTFWCVDYGPTGRRAGEAIWARANTLWAWGRLIPEPVAWLRGREGAVLVLARGSEVPLADVKPIEEAGSALRVLLKRAGAVGSLTGPFTPGDFAIGPVGRWSRRALLLRPERITFGGKRSPEADLCATADRVLSAARAASAPA